jgi:hypothetical protein
MARVFAAMLIGLLPSCAHNEPAVDWEMLDATAATAINDDEFCRSYGAQPGTQSYVDCRLRLSTQRAKR